MFSEAFVGSSSRLTSASSFCTGVCLAFALVVAGTFGPEPLYAQDVPPTSPTADLWVSPNVLSIPEGGTGTYTVSPIGPPPGNVTVTVSTGDPTVATVSSSSLNFSPPFTATLVTVTAVDNDIVNPPGQRSTTITHSAIGYPSRTVVVNVIDDEASTEASISEPYVPDNLLPAFADTAMIADIVVEVRQPIAPRRLPKATGGDNPLTYSLLGNLPEGLVFHAATRQLSGTPTTETDSTAAMIYRVRDVNFDADSLLFTITVTPPDLKPTFGDATIANLVAEVDQEVIWPLPLATGGDGPLRYSLSNLPDGLALGTQYGAAAVRGAATATDTTIASYTVTDVDGDATTLTFTIAITDDPDLTPTFGAATIAPLTATACQAIARSLPAATGGDEPLTYSVSNLPDGLVFHANTRQLQGIPTILGDEGQTITYTGTYAVTDADGDAATLPFTITVHTGLDAPDWVRAENYLGADSTDTWGGSVLLTWALSSQHAFVEAYRIYREMWTTHSADEHGQLVALDEPRDEFVPWARVDAVPGVSLGRAIVQTLDYRATRWAVAAECGGQRTSLSIAGDPAKVVPATDVLAQQDAAASAPVVQSAMTATAERVGAIDASVPAAFALGPNYPNPFNPATTIQYSLPQAAEVRLTIHNAVGQVLHTLVSEYQPAGRYAIRYDGRALSAGIYFYRLQAGRVSQVGKMVLLK